MFGWAFQSTFPRGERRSLSCIFIHDELFQSTFPRGERQNVCRLFLIFCHFNPRSRVGNDAIALIPPIIPPISIHVPAWGTTEPELLSIIIFLISIHVPAWGTTFSQYQVHSLYSISIHVPAWGTTFYSSEMSEEWKISIHVPAWGTTKMRDMLLKMHTFQSTFPRGERPIML